MSAPKITTAVLSDPDVLEKRKTAEAAIGDWIEQIARTAVETDVSPPDNLPSKYTTEWVEQLIELAWTLDRAEQELFLALHTDYQVWRDLNRAAGRAA